MKNKHNLEDLFKDGFKDFAPKPSEGLWHSIKMKLAFKQLLTFSISSLNIYYIGAFVGLLTTAVVYLQQEKQSEREYSQEIQLPQNQEPSEANLLFSSNVFNEINIQETEIDKEAESSDSKSFHPSNSPILFPEESLHLTKETEQTEPPSIDASSQTNDSEIRTHSVHRNQNQTSIRPKPESKTKSETKDEKAKGLATNSGETILDQKIEESDILNQTEKRTQIPDFIKPIEDYNAETESNLLEETFRVAEEIHILKESPEQVKNANEALNPKYSLERDLKIVSNEGNSLPTKDGIEVSSSPLESASREENKLEDVLMETHKLEQTTVLVYDTVIVYDTLSIPMSNPSMQNVFKNKSPWSIDLAVHRLGYNFMYDSDDAALANSLNAASKDGSAFNLEVTANYSYQGWLIQSGLAFQEMREDFYHFQKINTDSVIQFWNYFPGEVVTYRDTLYWGFLFDSTSSSYVYVPYIKDSTVVLYDSTQINITNTYTEINFFEHVNKYSYIEIPLSISKEIYRNKNLGVGLRAGTRLGLFVHAKGKVFTELENTPMLELSSTELPFLFARFHFDVGLPLSYQIHPHYSLLLEPNYRISMHSIYESGHSFQVSQRGLGVRFGIRYHLHQSKK